MKETQTTTQSPKQNNNKGRLPIDSLIQIWAHLPLKSLYKFKSVSKLWNSSISSDPLLSTLRHHLTSSSPPPPPPPPDLLLFLLHTPNEPVKIPDRPLFISTRPIDDILTHHHHHHHHHHEPGLTRIRNGFTPYVDHSLDLLPSKGPLICVASVDFFYLCNPSTQQFLRVPRGQDGHSPPCGFGYLGGDNTYVLARFSGGPRPTRCWLLEFGPGYASSATWRGVKPDCPAPVEGFGVMVDGSFYWKVIAHVSDDVGNAFVVCLDVKKEEYRVVPRPEGNENEVILYDQLYLVEFKGCLCAIDNFSRPPRMGIWSLTSGDEGQFHWVRKYNIFISGMDRDMVYPFCDYEGENGDEIVLCNGTRSRLYCYNLKSRSIKQVYKTKHRTSDRLALYTPGLFPLSMAE